jgi:hypothetical protein
MSLILTDITKRYKKTMYNVRFEIGKREIEKRNIIFRDRGLRNDLS